MRSLLLPFAVLLGKNSQRSYENRALPSNRLFPQFRTVTVVAASQASLLPANRCALFCPQDYTPLCAERGGVQRTFSNRCELTTTNCVRQHQRSSSAWTFKHIGECITDRCQMACTLDYTPVCGQFSGELRTFSNLCAMKAFSCEHKQSELTELCVVDLRLMKIPHFRMATVRTRRMQ